MMSPRYAPIVCVLIALALVPTVLHSYVGAVTRDGRVVHTLAPTLAGFASEKSAKQDDWAELNFATSDWMQRRYIGRSTELMLTVVRSYDAKRLYHHPENAAAYGNSFSKSEWRVAAGRPQLPVHVARTTDASGPIALYALHYDDRFIDNPITFQIQTAAQLLFKPRAPMTLFFVYQRSNATGTDPLETPAAALLYDTIQQFANQPAH